MQKGRPGRTNFAFSAIPEGTETNSTTIECSKVKRRSTRTEETNGILPLARVLPDRLFERTRERQNQRVEHRKKNDLKLAFSEFYLMLVLLQNYQRLNFTGFRKILKKHDKLFETKRGEQWRCVSFGRAFPSLIRSIF